MGQLNYYYYYYNVNHILKIYDMYVLNDQHTTYIRHLYD